MASSNISKYDQIVSVDNDHPGHLTFGLELEFLIFFIDGDDEDPEPREYRSLFRTSGDQSSNLDREIDALLLERLRETFTNVRHSFEDEYHEPHENVPYYDQWRVTKDLSVESTNSGRYESIGREITSPVMRSDDAMAKYEISGMCRAIRRVRVNLNNTTSTHVHVGRGDLPFSILTIKKFITLFWITEQKLMALHHPARRSSVWCYLVTEYSRLALKDGSTLDAEEESLGQNGLEEMARFVPPVLSTLEKSQLAQVWGQTDIQDVARLMQGSNYAVSSQRGSVGFDRFLPAGRTGGNTCTFEFRQMAGSLDAENIMMWVQVCVTFTNFARFSSPETFKSLMLKIHNAGADYTGLTLLGDLGLRREAYHFARRVHRYGQTQEYFPGEDAGNLLVPLMW